MSGELSLRFVDFDGDEVTTTIPTYSVADAGDQPTWDAAVGALAAAMDALSIGRNRYQKQTQIIVDNGTGNASTPLAQDSVSLIVEMQDAGNGRVYIERIPMPDLTIAVDGSGNAAWEVSGTPQNRVTTLNPAHAAAVTFIAAIEAVWRNPATGNSGNFARAYVEE